jgi:hypothetical protein
LAWTTTACSPNWEEHPASAWTPSEVLSKTADATVAQTSVFLPDHRACHHSGASVVLRTGAESVQPMTMPWTGRGVPLVGAWEREKGPCGSPRKGQSNEQTVPAGALRTDIHAIRRPEWGNAMTAHGNAMGQPAPKRTRPERAPQPAPSLSNSGAITARP